MCQDHAFLMRVFADAINYEEAVCHDMVLPYFKKVMDYIGLNLKQPTNYSEI